MTFLLIALFVSILGFWLERWERKRHPNGYAPKPQHPPKRLFRYDYGFTMGDFLPHIPRLLGKQGKKGHHRYLSATQIAAEYFGNARDAAWVARTFSEPSTGRIAFDPDTVLWDRTRLESYIKAIGPED